MKFTIPAMSHAEFKARLHYNPETGWFTFLVLKGGRKPGERAGHFDAARGYRYVSMAGKYIPEHRAAWFYTYGVWPEMEIDHKNRDQVDNRLINLRLVTHGENRQNMTEYASNTSGHKGVYWCKQTSKWRAQINHNKKRHYLGGFPNFESAVQAYTEAATRLHRFNTVHATVH